MKRLLVTLFIAYSFLNSKDSLLLQQKNALYVQNLIESEEKIAQQYEKYLINELKIPTLEDLSTDEYLGSNFSKRNILGSNIAFEDSSNLKIKYAVTKKFDSYVSALYNRDLYRDNTEVYVEYDGSNIKYLSSYVLIKLESQEAQNIHKLLLSNVSTDNDCKNFTPEPTNGTYCNYNFTTIRWYNSDSNWIEYNKKEFNLGNVTINNPVLLTDTKLVNDLAVGSYIFIENGSKYIKLINNEIKKVK